MPTKVNPSANNPMAVPYQPIATLALVNSGALITRQKVERKYAVPIITARIRKKSLMDSPKRKTDAVLASPEGYRGSG